MRQGEVRQGERERERETERKSKQQTEAELEILTVLGVVARSSQSARAAGT